MTMPDEPITIHVRSMLLSDLAEVLVIDRASFSLPWPESAYRYEIQDNESSICQVAELLDAQGNVRLVGLVVTWVILDEAHIATIATHPDFRRQGVARRLLIENLKSGLESGVRSATLEVREHNLTAQELYRQFHFEVVGRRPRYYRDDHEDALLMTVKGLDERYYAWLAQGAPLQEPSSEERHLVEVKGEP